MKVLSFLSYGYLREIQTWDLQNKVLTVKEGVVSQYSKCKYKYRTNIVSFPNKLEKLLVNQNMER